MKDCVEIGLEILKRKLVHTLLAPEMITFRIKVTTNSPKKEFTKKRVTEKAILSLCAAVAPQN